LRTPIGPRRVGASIVDLLIALAILGMLMALLLPALHSIRESARRTQCLNNLRQLGLAVQNHVTVRVGELPRTATNSIDPQGRKLTPSFSPHRNLLAYLDGTQLMSRIDPFDVTINTPASPAVFLNPGMAELARLRMPAFLCPSDAGRGGTTNYRGNMGFGPGVFSPSETNWAFVGNTAGAFVHARVTRISEFRDGLDYTALFSEKVVGDGEPRRYNAWTDYFYATVNLQTADDAVRVCGSLRQPSPEHASYGGWVWLFGGWNSSWYNHILEPNAAVPDCSAGGVQMAGGGDGTYAARSYHPGGVNVVFASGSARFINDQISLPIWRAIASRAGNETLGDDW
jgi:hypothetical protein